MTLAGLERDHCQCPHWGYMIEGRMRVSYEDGTEEVVTAGDLYYWPSGHTVVVEEAVRMVEFSPHDQMSQVLGHVIGKLEERVPSNQGRRSPPARQPRSSQLHRISRPIPRGAGSCS